MENKDKTWIKSYREGDKLILETYLPNDVHGDFVFEWDLDGSAKRAWELYLAELDMMGTRGKLEHRKYIFTYDPVFDTPQLTKNYPLESYKMIIEDFGPEVNPPRTPLNSNYSDVFKKVPNGVMRIDKLLKLVPVSKEKESDK